MRKDKKGISPIIATVLLIAIVVVLASIIFIWARSIVKEEVQKFGEPISRACEKVEMSVNKVGQSLIITNNGDNVNIYNIAFHIQKNDGSDVEENTGAINLNPGRSVNVNIEDIDDIKYVSPILKGTRGGYEEEYICDNKFEVN